MLWLHKPKKKKASHISTPNLKKDETLLPSSTKLLRAPSKRKLKSQLKQKRKSLDHCSSTYHVQLQRNLPGHKNITCPLNHENEVKDKCHSRLTCTTLDQLPYQISMTSHLQSFRNLHKQKTLTCPLNHENEVKVKCQIAD